MKRNLTICTFFIIAAIGISVSAKSQEQKKPSERQFSQEINKVKQMQAERNKLIAQTKAQTAVSTTTTTGTGSVPVNTENQNSIKPQPTQTIKPSSGSMRKPQRPVAPGAKY